MSGKINFFKMTASGNDFILMDHRKKTVRDIKNFARAVCPVHTGIGADGVLLIEQSKRADFRLRIFNSDGSEAEACGNGYCCVGLFTHQILKFPRQMDFETLAGTIKAEVSKTNKDRVKVWMAKPSGFKQEVAIQVGAIRYHLSFINTGVPHAVIFSEELDQIPVPSLGRLIRFHETFQPKGTNVNFVQVLGKDKLRIRTYERGVEEETLACGTGSTAAAITAVLTKRISKTPVSVITKTGEILRVNFTCQGNTVKDVTLEGRAKFVYEGKLLLKTLQ